MTGPFQPGLWEAVTGLELSDITYHRAVGLPVVRVAFNRPEVRNAFRPHTVDELYAALDHARSAADVGAVLLTGNGPSPKDGGWAFCSGGDQRVRGRYGYEHAAGSSGRLHVLEAQRLIRFMPKVVICVVPGWAAGGGHSLHVVSDLTLASAEHARFKQTDADRMGMVNRVVPHAELERTALDWGRRIVAKSPTAQRMLKYSFNLIDDGLVGQQLFAGETTRLAYMAEEAVEGRDAFLEKRDPDFSRFPWHV